MKKAIKIISMVVLTIIGVALIAFGVFWYRNIHWYDKYEKALAKVSAEEKQVALPSGSVINYGEVVNDKPHDSLGASVEGRFRVVDMESLVGGNVAEG